MEKPKPKISDVLKQIRADAREKSILFRNQGICGNFDGYTTSSFRMSIRKLAESMGIFYKDWPLFSGDEVFPVPGRKGTSPEKTFMRAGNMWLPNSHYAKRRFKLLDWLIEQFEAKGA